MSERVGLTLPRQTLRSVYDSTLGNPLFGTRSAACSRRPIDDVCERFRTVSDAVFHLTDSAEPVEGLRLLWRGEVEAARPILTRFLALADARGEEVSYALQRMNVCA